MSILQSQSQPDAFTLCVTDLAASLDPSAPGMRARYEDDAAAEVRAEMETSFRAYIPHAWRMIDPAPFVPNWHTDAAADHLQAVTDGQITRLIINQPPGTAKSLVTSVLHPSWEWGPRDLPQLRHLCISYGATLALRDAQKCRELIKSPWYQGHWRNRFQFSDDQDAKGYYLNTRGGYRHSCGLGGDIPGTRADRLLIDDPNKLDDRLNVAALQGPIDKWSDTLHSRLVNDLSSVVLVMQRLNEGDLAGHFLKQDGWTLLRLPRLFEPKFRCRVFIHGELFFEDPRRLENEPLHQDHPALKSLATVLRNRAEHGEWRFAGEEQQRPTPLSGGMVQLAWVRRWHVNGSCGATGTCLACLPDAWDELLQSWDCAFKKGEKNSWVVGGAWGRRQGRAYLLDQVRGHWDLPDTMDALLRFSEKWPFPKKLVEDKANGPAVIQMLGGIVPGLIPQGVEGDKVSRMSAVAPFFRAGNVFIPEDGARNGDGLAWVPEYVAEVTQFPAGVHNDQADQTSQGLWELLGGIQLSHQSFSELNRNVPGMPFETPAMTGNGNGHAADRERDAPGTQRGSVGVVSGGGGGTNPFDISGIMRIFGR